MSETAKQYDERFAQSMKPIPKEVTLRDQFAMAALTGICAKQALGSVNIIAGMAYAQADAMMKEREKKEEK